MMGRPLCKQLEAAVHVANDSDMGFLLVHQSALMGWGIDDNAFLLGPVDLLVTDRSGEGLPKKPGSYSETALAEGSEVRLWSPESLRLGGEFASTACPKYGCRALAPELVLRTLPYSPEAPMLVEQRALLALVLNHKNLKDSEIEAFAKYVHI